MLAAGKNLCGVLPPAAVDLCCRSSSLFVSVRELALAVSDILSSLRDILSDFAESSELKRNLEVTLEYREEL